MESHPRKAKPDFGPDQPVDHLQAGVEYLEFASLEDFNFSQIDENGNGSTIDSIFDSILAMT
jgi:hypothetical protein